MPLRTEQHVVNYMHQQPVTRRLPLDAETRNRSPAYGAASDSAVVPLAAWVKLKTDTGSAYVLSSFRRRESTRACSLFTTV